MPAAAPSQKAQLKRKTSKSERGSSKRLRVETDEDDVQAQLLDLEKGILGSRKNYNDISTLIKHAKSKDDEVLSFSAAVALCRVFMSLMAADELQTKQSQSEKDAIVARWLRERYAEFKEILLQLLNTHANPSDVLTLCMRLLKSEAAGLKQGSEYTFPAVFLSEIVRKVLDSEDDEELRDIFCEKYLIEYHDIRFYTFSAIDILLSDPTSSHGRHLLDNAINVLEVAEDIPTSGDELQESEDFYVDPPKKKSHALYNVSAHKKHAQAAWLAVMRSEMDKDRRKRILGLMTSSIAPWFLKPELLMDFLTDSYNSGGSTSLLSLSGVFYLIQERNLDYPSFYKKLYSLLDSQLLHSKHRSKFFRLLETFLSSTHLPAVLVASFIKRLSRLLLFAPPAGVVAVVPWIYNMLKRHPTCTFMIHRVIRDPEMKKIIEDEGMDDPFLADEEDPMETNAIESCLWELVMLQSHYHPNVATLAKIISEQFTKQSYNLEDFLDHSYASMLEAELNKEIKKAPVVEYEIPKRIFTKYEPDSGMEDSLLVKVIDFS